MTVTNTPRQKTTRFIGLANLFFGDVNTTPTALAGLMMRDPGVEVNETQDEVELMATHKSGPLAIDKTTDRVEITGVLAQFQATVLGLASGVDENGQIVEIGGAPAIRKQFSCKVQGTLADGSNAQFEIFSCVIQPNGPKVFSPAGHALIPIIIKGQEDDANDSMARWTFGDGNVTATLATGILTRTAGTPQSFHKIASEVDGSDDALTSIGGTSLVDGELLTLQRANSDEIITITNTASGSGTVDLTGTDDLLLANDFDTLVLAYNEGNTEWVEQSRYITGL